MKTPWIYALALAGLAACGPLHVESPVERLVRGLVVGESEQSVAAPTGSFTRAQIEAQDVDLLRVSIISREATALAALSATNGSKTSWLAVGGFGFTFDRGVLVGTRGLGPDLMGSDVDSAIAAMPHGGNYARTLDFLNSLDQIEREVFSCVSAPTGQDTLTIFERNYVTTVIEETCTGETETFKNTYWRDARGVIWQSRQWISSGAGYLGYQRL